MRSVRPDPGCRVGNRHPERNDAMESASWMNGGKQIRRNGANFSIPNPGFITDRAGVTGVEPSDATGVEPSEADPFPSDRLPVSRANPTNTSSLSAFAMLSYMDRQSEFRIDIGLVLVLSTLRIPDVAGESRRFGVLTPSLDRSATPSRVSASRRSR